MLHADAGLDTAIAEQDIQELGQLSRYNLDSVTDCRFETFPIDLFKQLNPSENMVPDNPLWHFVSGKFHCLFNTDVFRLGAGFSLRTEKPVGDGKTVTGE